LSHRTPNVSQNERRVFLQSFKKTQIILFTKAEVNKNIDILISFTDHVRFSFTDRQSNMEKKNSNKHLHHKPLLTQTHVYEQIGFQVFAYKYKKKNTVPTKHSKKNSSFFLVSVLHRFLSGGKSMCCIIGI